jgi:hypothetical protein
MGFGFTRVSGDNVFGLSFAALPERSFSAPLMFSSMPRSEPEYCLADQKETSVKLHGQAGDLFLIRLYFNSALFKNMTPSESKYAFTAER